MEFKNLTPFSTFPFFSLGPDDQKYQVVVVRGTFEIQPDQSLRGSTKQKPINMKDEFHGEINCSSIKMESDLAPFKPQCDVIVNGTAYAPNGNPARRFDVGINIQSEDKVLLDKKLSITGPRFWRKRWIRPGWTLTKPERITKLPLQYEYAYGGECRIEHSEPAAKHVKEKFRLSPEQRASHPDGTDQAPMAHTVCMFNSVGRGFTERWFVKARKLSKIPAPQIECPKNPIRDFGKFYLPQGFGVVTKSWQPRIKNGGTYDDIWKKERHPLLPKDFDLNYWNGAHVDMQIPWLKGDEKITLENLTSNGSLTFSLPGFQPYLMLYYEAGPIIPVHYNLDTLFIEPDDSRVSLIWRAFIPLKLPMTHMESRISLPSDYPQVINLKQDKELVYG